MKLLQRRKKLGDLLIEKGLITSEALSDVLVQVQQENKRLGALLLEKGLLNEETLAQLLAAQLQLLYYPLADFRLDPSFYKVIPVDFMYRYPFVPYAEKKGVLTVVLADPTNLSAIDELELILKRPLDFGVSTRSAIMEALKRSEGSSQVLKKMEADFRPVLVREDEGGEEVLSVEKISKDQSPVVKLVDTMILNALQRRASDIHIQAGDREVAVRYRIDGILYQMMEPLDFRFHAPLVSRIKVMSELDIAEKRKPQDGRFKMRLERKTVDFRVSILPGSFGEDVVIRILDKEYITAGIDDLSLDKLGFNPEDLKKFRKAIIEPYGMVLVTGPTGSGKTTTLYAAITEINTEDDKIITIEDPVEYQLRNVIQIPVNERKGLTFAKGLRSILRHDPDKIMVGEIRDSETAQIAIQSALTGHLVFTTVHANNAFDVIGRFVNMGIEPYNFVSSLNCVLAQRLVRAICQNCKSAVRMTPQLAETSGLDYDQYRDKPLYEGKGCAECNWTGFKGRNAITEFLDLSDTIREMMLDRRPTSEIRKQALSERMTTLRQAGLEKVLRGESTLREVNRVTFIE